MPDVQGAADKGKGALTHKVGPLPLWGWAVAGVAAVVVVKKFTGGGSGSGAGPGLVTIPSIGSGGAPGSVATGGNAPVVSPAQNAAGGADTATGAAAVPWWAPSGQLANGWPSSHPMIPGTLANGGIPLTGQPSSNGSVGAGPATTTPTGAAPPPSTGGSWWTRLTNPSGNLPSGAAVTTIGGTVYSLSSDALGRAGITGAMPVANASAPVGTTASAPTGQFGGPGSGPARTDVQGVAPAPTYNRQWFENN